MAKACQKCTYGLVPDHSQEPSIHSIYGGKPVAIYPTKNCECCDGGFWDNCNCGEGYLDEFFKDSDVITSEQGVYLKPVGKAEDNPFSPPPRLKGMTWD